MQWLGVRGSPEFLQAVAVPGIRQSSKFLICFTLSTFYFYLKLAAVPPEASMDSVHLR